MVRVRVIRPWDFSTQAGDELVLQSLHPALASHVVVLEEVELEVATPEPVRRRRPPKQEQE